MMNNVIVRKNLSEMVAERLLELMASGHFKPLEKLPIENELMKLFGVGRSTIREAVKTLENAGRVKVRHGSGTFVSASSGSLDKLGHLIKTAEAPYQQEIMDMLEGRVIQDLARSKQEPNAILLHAIYEQQINAAHPPVNWDKWVTTVYHFKEILAGFCKNKILMELYLIFIDEYKKLLAKQVNDDDLLLKVNRLHQSILQMMLGST
jgi:DNA-binding FadR family transcriptional regulator